MTKISTDIGIHIPTILLPDSKIDLTKWCVVACDQYTSQPEYWKQVEELVGEDPSALHLVFPEVYLEAPEREKRIAKIAENMKRYMSENILVPQRPGFILVIRKTANGRCRKGLMVGLDLEHYNYEKGAQTLIRATEGTVVDRIPPRLKIREKASVEIPHIMVLIDDPENTVIEPLTQEVKVEDKLYDVELMMQGGHVEGYAINDEATLEGIVSALSKLGEPQAFQKKYNVDADKGVLLYAMGDGNHSLATAKACWETIKATLADEEIPHHPARFALVEVVNVYDEGLTFEPIHRVAFNVEPAQVLESMVSYYNEQQCEASYTSFKDSDALAASSIGVIPGKDTHVLPFVFQGERGAFFVKHPQHNLEVGTLQNFLDYYEKTQDDIRVDYVHGEEVVEDLASKPGNLGFILPPMDKHDLFKTVILEGVLPLKTFSMGEAAEKRFYLECRRIVKD